MEKYHKNNLSKIYCSKCDLIFESRKKFEKHLDSHNSVSTCEVCPIDTVFFKIADFLKRKSSRNLE